MFLKEEKISQDQGEAVEGLILDRWFELEPIFSFLALQLVTRKTLSLEVNVGQWVRNHLQDFTDLTLLSVFFYMCIHICEFVFVYLCFIFLYLYLPFKW